MSEQRKIKDYLSHGSPEDIWQALNGLGSQVLTICGWIQNNLYRTERNVALYNLLASVGMYVDMARDHYLREPIQILALATRSVYELDLRVRHVLSSEEALRKWVAELGKDRIEITEGLLQLPTGESSEISEVRQSMSEYAQSVKDGMRRHSLPKIERTPSSRSLAKSLGEEQLTEYDALFKFFSKLVHPSSFSVNAHSSEVHGQIYRNMLLTHLQLYALDALNRIQSDLGVPDDLPVEGGQSQEAATD